MMKRNLLSRMLLLFALIVGSVMSVWAEEVTLNYSSYSTETSIAMPESINTDFGSIEFSKGTNANNAPIYYSNGDAVRYYTGNTVTLNAGTNTITKVAITTTSGSIVSSAITPEGTSFSFNNKVATWEGSANTVTFTAAANGRFNKIVVTYTSGGSQSDTWTVTYNTNGATSGTVPTDDTEYDTDNNMVTVLGNTGSLAKTGYTFDGWNTKADGTGDDYTAGDKFTISANTTLYAKWEANTYDVILPATDTYGTYTMDKSNPVAYGTEVTLTYTPAAGYENYAATWSVNGTAISGNKFTMPNEAVTITAAVAEVIDYVALPFNYTGGTASDLTSVDGITANGLGSDYAASNAPYRVKFDNVGDYILIKTDSQPGKVTIGVKMIGGGSTSKITVKGSADGENFTSVQELTISGSQNDELSLETTNQFAATDRYVKIEFTTKGSNVGVGPISIAKPTTDPEIIVNNNKVELTAEDTSGEIAFTINNPVSGTSLTASSEDEWISNVTVDSDNSKVTFTTSANTGAAREGTITLTYGTLTKDVTVSQAAPIVKYAITINSMTNGTIEADVEEAAEGTTVTLTITPADGYSLSTITVTDEDEDEITLSGTGKTRTFIMPASAVTIDATFEKEHGVTYDFSFDVMGSEGWGGSYKEHIKDYSDASVVFSYASKQSGTITDIPAVKGLQTPGTRYVSVTLKEENSIIKAATFGLRHWTNKTITVTMYYSTDGGDNWTATEYSHAFTNETYGEDVTLTAVSLPAGTNAVKIEGGADQQYGVSFAKLDIEKAISVSKDYISFCSASALDFTNVEDLEALVVTKINETSVSTEKVETVPAGVGVILHKTGTATSFNVPAVATATKPETNFLVGVLEDTEIGGNGTDYVLKDGVFMKANAGTLAAGKAYLQVKTDANAAPALTIGFGDEGTTGIRSIENGQLTIDNVYYDLSGRRVAEPTKGVYIVNGKKVVIK